MYTCELSAADCSAFFGWDSDNVHNQNLTSETIDDNATWTHGKHTVQFGFGDAESRTMCARVSKPKVVHEWDPAYTTDWDGTSAQCPIRAVDLPSYCWVYRIIFPISTTVDTSTSVRPS